MNTSLAGLLMCIIINIAILSLPVSTSIAADDPPTSTQPDSQPATQPATQPASRPAAATKPAAKPTTRPAGKFSKAVSPIQQAIAQLADEAKESKAAGRLQHSESDFQRRTTLDIPIEDVLSALSQPANRDPFTDAYIRWQLSNLVPQDSSDPAIARLRELDDARFMKFITNLPVLLDSPRADRDAIALFDSAEKSSAKGVRVTNLAALRAASDALDQKTALAETFNTPAQGMRDWLAAQVKTDRAKQIMLDLHRCAATINAGWPSRAIKSRITKNAKAAATDSTVTAQQRQLIAALARSLIGARRSAINQITFKADGTIEVSMTNGGIDKGDVEKWLELMGAAP